MNWDKLENIEQLQIIDDESNALPVLIFKHSTRCSISATALDRLERKWKSGDGEKIKPYFLDLIKYRPISNEIAERYKIEHQSPQVLVIKNGKCTFSETHFDISYDTLMQQV